jgi:uncharacterized protein YdeI (YjbR/CyaY-like superfamily)
MNNQMPIVYNPKVDAYLNEGCGRCVYFKTPKCKVKTWQKELITLRAIVLSCGFKEELKWSQPCYTYKNKNILLISTFKNYVALVFFKGSLLKDCDNLLVSPGINSQAVKQLRFTSLQDIIKLEPVIKSYLNEAIEIEKAGLKVNFKSTLEPIPIELQQKLDSDNEFKKAFESLTKGRKRAYIIYFSQPKQSKTRLERIEKCKPKILNGEGLNDHYKTK